MTKQRPAYMDSPPKERRLTWDPNQGYREPPAPTSEPQRGYFLKGPVSLEWLGVAANLPGKALHAAICIRFLQGLQKAKTVLPSKAHLARLGISRRAWYEALSRLSEAGLIAVDQRRGRRARVTVVEPGSGSTSPVEHKSRRGGEP